MIHKISSKRFRAFKETEIPLSKINIFLGPNNSGKSAILSILSVLAQTFDSIDSSLPLQLKGKMEDLGTYQDIVYENDIARDIQLSLDFSYGSMRQDKNKPNIVRISVDFHYQRRHKKIEIKSIEVFYPPNDLVLRTRKSSSSDRQLIDFVPKDYEGVPTGSGTWNCIDLLHYVPFVSPYYGLDTDERYYRALRRLGRFTYGIAREFGRQASSIYSIGPFRKSPERLYTYSGESPSEIGVHGEKCIDILAAKHNSNDLEDIQIFEKLSNWYRDAGIANKIFLDEVSTRYYQVKLEHIDTHESQNIADVGYGCSQILPILVAGYTIEPGSTLILSEPEIHLHPKAQAEVGKFLFDISERDVQLLVETHSEYLLLRLQSYIAERKLKPEDVYVYYVYSKSDGEKKIYKRIPLGENGYYSEDWPEGFFPEKLKEAKRIANNARQYNQ